MQLFDGLGNKIEIASPPSTGGGDITAEPLYGKTWLCVGDSISTYPGYRQMIVDRYDLVELSGAYKGGMRVGYGGGATSCVLEYLDKISSGTPDIITIALGTNDNNDGNKVGTVNDDPDAQSADSYTFIGCYKALISRLWDKYGYVPMLLLTPYPRGVGGGITHVIHDAIHQVGAYYSIPVFDLTEDSGLPVGELPGEFEEDGLHINCIGHSISSPRIADMMNFVIRKWEFPATKLLPSGQTSRTLSVGQTTEVHAYSQPTHNTDFKKVVWTTSNPSVATVGDVSYHYSSAKVTAVGAGSCTVTAELNGKTVAYSITVA